MQLTNVSSIPKTLLNCAQSLRWCLSLQNHQEIHLSTTTVSGVVSDATRLLEELNANFNQLKKLPDTIGFELVNLRKLSVNSNKLDFLPYSTSHLTNLRHLDARLNCLRSLPEDLENLVNLEILNVSQNFQYFTNLPNSIGLLSSVVEMDISYNKITTLPNSIGCLKTLQKINVEANPLVSPPKEAVEHGINLIKEYLIDRMNNVAHKSNIKKSWLGKFVKCATFNGPINVDQTDRVSKDGVVMSIHRSKLSYMNLQACHMHMAIL